MNETRQAASHEESPETALLRAARGGSQEALGTLLQNCGPRLLALIRLRLGPALRSHLESRDILQTTLVKAIKGFDSFNGQGSSALMAWLARIAAHEIQDQADYHGRDRRDARRTVSLDEPERGDHLAALVRSETSRIALDERAQSLERALEAMAPEQREVIVLRKLEELSFAEIAERLGRSPDACRMLVARAMARLTLQLGQSS